MGDRDRLIEILQDTLHEWECDVSIKTLTEIAEHLLANGVIVPPCKVGDTLYEITSRNTISEYEVTAIRIELFNVFIDWKLTQGFVDRYISDMPVGEIGKTVFLTREEAEKAFEKNK